MTTQLHLGRGERALWTECGIPNTSLHCTSDRALFARVKAGTEPRWTGPSEVCPGCDPEPSMVAKFSLSTGPRRCDNWRATLFSNRHVDITAKLASQPTPHAWRAVWRDGAFDEIVNLTGWPEPIPEDVRLTLAYGLATVMPDSRAIAELEATARVLRSWAEIAGADPSLAAGYRANAAAAEAEAAMLRDGVHVATPTASTGQPTLGSMPIERAKELTAACVRVAAHIAIGVPGTANPELPDVELEELLVANRLVSGLKPEETVVEGTTHYTILTCVDPRMVAALYALKQYEGSPMALLNALGWSPREPE